MLSKILDVFELRKSRMHACHGQLTRTVTEQMQWAWQHRCAHLTRPKKLSTMNRHKTALCLVQKHILIQTHALLSTQSLKAWHVPCLRSLGWKERPQIIYITIKQHWTSTIEKFFPCLICSFQVHWKATIKKVSFMFWISSGQSCKSLTYVSVSKWRDLF